MEKGQSEKILDTAYQCLAKHGYANVSLRDIAAQANVALSQLHYHYRNKEGLFVAVMKRALENLKNNLSSILSQNVPSAEKISLLSEYCKLIPKENADLARLFFDFAVQSMWIPAFRRNLQMFLAQMREMIAIRMEPGAAEDGLRSYTEEQLARFITGALLGVIGQRIWDTDTAKDSGEFFILADVLR